MARILILIGAHLWCAPRPQKEAAALAAAGHEVTIAGGWTDPQAAEWDRGIAARAAYRFTVLGDLRAGSLPRLACRYAKALRRRLAARTLGRTNLFRPDLLGLFAHEALRHARRARADLTIVHHEAGLWVARSLRREGLRVGVDMEDWFSEDLLPPDRIHRPVAFLKELEGDLLRAAHYSLTTSQSLSAALANAYAAPPPAVAHNTFPDEPTDGQRRDRPALGVPSLHWFSQTIGPRRGLETLFAALPLLSAPCEIHLRGSLTRDRGWLDSITPPAWRERVRVHPLVPNTELPSRIAEHDIGLALEESYCPSRDLTITNKLFQYLQAGLAVVASDTRGQREAAAPVPEACQVVPQLDVGALAAALNLWLDDPARLAAAKAGARHGFKQHFAWPRSAAVIVQRAAEALARPPA
jgi:glycosyltransferase involved in cell wall biosynthesis